MPSFVIKEAVCLCCGEDIEMILPAKIADCVVEPIKSWDIASTREWGTLI